MPSALETWERGRKRKSKQRTKRWWHFVPLFAPFTVSQQLHLFLSPPVLYYTYKLNSFEKPFLVLHSWLPLLWFYILWDRWDWVYFDGTLVKYTTRKRNEEEDEVKEVSAWRERCREETTLRWYVTFCCPFWLIFASKVGCSLFYYLFLDLFNQTCYFYAWNVMISVYAICHTSLWLDYFQLIILSYHFQ